MSTYANLSSQISNIEKKIKSTYNPFTRRTLKKERASLKVQQNALKNKGFNASVHKLNHTLNTVNMKAAKNQKLGINREEDRLKKRNNAAKKAELGKINNKRYYFTRSNKVNAERDKNRQAIINKYNKLKETRRSRIIQKNPFIGIFDKIENIDELKIRFYDKFEPLIQMLQSFSEPGSSVTYDYYIELEKLQKILVVQFINRLIYLYNTNPTVKLSNELTDRLELLNGKYDGYTFNKSLHRTLKDTNNHEIKDIHGKEITIDIKKGDKYYGTNLYRVTIVKLYNKSSIIEYLDKNTNEFLKLVNIEADALLSYLIDEISKRMDRLFPYSQNFSSGDAVVGSIGVLGQLLSAF